MKKHLVIPFLIAVYFICSARSCSDENPESMRMQNKIAAAMDSIREAFETDFLSPENIHAFEYSARQKLLDFADYYQILNDTSADLEFREKSANLIASLFISVDSKSVVFTDEEHSTIFNLISGGLNNDYPVTNLKIENIKDISPLERINDSLYSGKLGFQMTLVLKENPGKEKSRNVSLNYHVSRKNKAFGDETMNVWSVKLGEMEE
jgi:hypothetical protein